MKKITVTEFMKPGMMQEKVLEESFSKSAPSGNYTADALNRLVAATNMVLSKFGADAYPEFAAGKSVSQLPPQFLRVLAMIAKAAEDMGETPMRLDQLIGDRDLLMLANSIEELSRNPKLDEFLNKDMEDMEGEDTEDENTEGGKGRGYGGSGGGMKSETDQLFASRMMR